jgi:hypothetical protein
MAAIGRIAGDDKDLIAAVIRHCVIPGALRDQFELAKYPLMNSCGSPGASRHGWSIMRMYSA